MSPRDMWDCNPVYHLDFFTSYCEFLMEHLDIVPSFLVEESTMTDEELFDDDDSRAGYEFEILDESSDSEDDNGFVERFLVEVIMGPVGTRNNPIDLTDDE